MKTAGRPVHLPASLYLAAAATLSMHLELSPADSDLVNESFSGGLIGEDVSKT